VSNTRTAEYRAFDANTLIGYLAGIEVVAEILGESQWTANEVGDGNVNQVFIVEPAPGSEGTPVVVKQALPYLRVAGDDWPLTRERMRHEIAALERYGDLVPGRAPAVIHTAPEMSLVVMEYLAAHEVMRGPLMAGRTFPQFAAHVGTFVAETCFATSDLALSGPAKKTLVVERSNPELCELQEDFVFTNPFMESEENEWNPALDELVARVRADGALQVASAEAKRVYLTNTEALLHGDLHTGSLMVTNTDTRVIDPEFAFFGPIGYDLGTLFANLVINRLSHRVHTPDAAERAEMEAWLDGCLVDTWSTFARVFDERWQRHEGDGATPAAYWDFDGGPQAFAHRRAGYLARVLVDSASQGGCEMLRRLMGIVTVPELGAITDNDLRAEIETDLAAIARRWLLDAEQITRPEDLLVAVHEVIG